MDQIKAEKAGNHSAMFGPLEFDRALNDWEEDHIECPCPLCDDSFNLKIGFHIFLKHLFEVHHLVIEDVQNIANLRSYLEYWKSRFKQVALESVVPCVSVEPSNVKYHLLSNLIKEDKDIRHKLKLESVLKQQEFERNDESYVRDCLFCRLNFEGTRQNYLKHLSEQHNLQLGNPQNLVFIEELVELLNSKLTDLQCVYCEKFFPERNVLKEHMRKKLHKRINPQNRAYDRFYMVNYLEPGKDWQSIQKEDDRLPVNAGEKNSDEEYSDWNESADQITCLFCAHREADMEKLHRHALAAHDFDFNDSAKHLNFYQRVKLVNYVRKQVHNRRCVFCDAECENGEKLLRHMRAESHFRVPDCKVFDQPLYFFSTYENDAMLYLLEDEDNASA